MFKIYKNMQAQSLQTLNITKFSMLFLVPQFVITSEHMIQGIMKIKKRFAEVSFFSKIDTENQQRNQSTATKWRNVKAVYILHNDQIICETNIKDL
jgi:hypothetical protein